MKLDIHFRLEEKIDFLRRKGYEVKEEIESMSWSVYHNDVESADVKIYAVYKDGIAFHRPCGMNYNPDEWVDSIFQVEIEQKLKKFILEV